MLQEMWGGYVPWRSRYLLNSLNSNSILATIIFHTTRTRTQNQTITMPTALITAPSHPKLRVGPIADNKAAKAKGVATAVFLVVAGGGLKAENHLVAGKNKGFPCDVGPVPTQPAACTSCERRQNWLQALFLLLATRPHALQHVEPIFLLRQTASFVEIEPHHHNRGRKANLWRRKKMKKQVKEVKVTKGRRDDKGEKGTWRWRRVRLVEWLVFLRRKKRRERTNGKKRKRSLCY